VVTQIGRLPDGRHGTRPGCDQRRNRLGDPVTDEPMKDGQKTGIPAVTVLVVDDDAMIGAFLAEMLVDMGYEVCAVVATEEDAVAQAARFNPNLLIVDEELREGSGTSAVQRITRNGPVPCVFISGSLAHVAGPGRRVLQKPFRAKDLLRAIHYVVASADISAAPLVVPANPVPER
jgi:CheY-like chemotaxis protein